MKKFLLAAVLVLGTASLAMAWGHGGWGHNGGGWGHNSNCWNNGGGWGMGQGYNNGQAPAPVVNSADEARAKVQEVINSGYKGYKIGKVDTIQVPRGTVYEVNVTDAGGNQFVFHVNPWGNVIGPMTR